MAETPVYSIGAVAKMLGIPVATLRTWQDRYGVVTPVRSAGGHRLYSRKDAEHLRFVAERVAEGMSPGDAHRLLADSLARSPRFVPAALEGPILILLAERDPFAAEFAEYFLRTEGYEVTLALDGADAVRALEASPPQVAIVDLLISGGAGLDLVRQTRDAGVSVLAISTLEARERALEAGASAFLQKPLDPLQLVSTVKDLLGRSAFLRQTVTAR
jgi:DNA-binding transcriptional MerR regulator